MVNHPNRSRRLTITIGGCAVAVQVLDTTCTRRISGRIVESVPADPCPLTAAEVADRVQKVFDAHRCRATREDIAWAVDRAGNDYCTETDDRYLIRAVPTDAERVSQRHSARHEAEDGLV